MNNVSSISVYQKLQKQISDASLYRPIRVERYEAGTELVYDVSGVPHTYEGTVRLVIDRFVGGGFAGQVYKIRIKDIECEGGRIPGLEKGKEYAMKILIPPTSFSLLFRNALYWLGFQGPFQLQVNPAAARSGALWQKFIRRAAKIRFGDERAVVDIYATFVDRRLGSCGELREWIEGRTWRLEVDDHMDLLSQWKKGRVVHDEMLGSPEYRAKHEFMYRFVELLHDTGCHEFARQYEWYTCKSQPNCLKRKEMEGAPASGLVAVDFRAGLTLLPFLPMSPGDFKLIGQGIMRGSLVQFDRGDIKRLEQFIHEHEADFFDMSPMLEELKHREQVYRDSVPDVTHNHFRLLYSKRLWGTILSSALAGWRVRNLVDETSQKGLQKNRTLLLLFYFMGLIPLLGGFFRRLWGRSDWRKHYLHMLTSWRYLRAAIRGRIAEVVIGWHRAERVDDKHALRISKRFWPFVYHLPLSILPIGLHRFFTDWAYAKKRMDYFTLRPVRLYFNAGLREEWLREMVTDGKTKHLLSEDDAQVILSQVNEPFIQKYLKSLAVHVCTLPVTQIVSVMLALIYVFMHPQMPRAQAWGMGLGIIALFQVIPISPGSLVRGLYVVYLVVSERNFKDYNIAVFVGFFKYIGYLAFPIQMTYHYPTLARFMASHWATEAVHIVPVFGERGALLEHGVFCMFYNWPLTIRRRMRKMIQIRNTMRPRYWHIGLYAIAGAVIFGLIDYVYLYSLYRLPVLREIWWLALLLPLFCGAATTLGARGASLAKRFVGATICGVLLGIFYTGLSAMLGYGSLIPNSHIVISGVWRVFLFAILSPIGAVITELRT